LIWIAKLIALFPKFTSSRKEINAPSYFETIHCGCSLVWKDISLPTNKGGTLTTRVQIPATAPPFAQGSFESLFERNS
jgi:hypothetical protein